MIVAKARILVVEDDAIVAMELEDRLQSLGYGVCAIVSSGEAAIAQAENQRPDLVLMDIRLKGQMDGVEAAREIRARFGIPVIYLTAYADEKTLRRAKVTEPYGYIVKPFEERELHTAVEIALYKHQVENRLRQSERWLATLLRSISDAVIATDREGLITFMNLTAETLTGWERKDAIGKDLTTVFIVTPEGTWVPGATPMQRTLQDGLVVSLTDHILTSRDSREIPIDASLAPIRDDNENISGVILAFRDITGRKQTEKEKEKLQAQLYQAQKMEAVGVLAGGVAHDFNNLLTAIIGYSDFALHLLGESKLLRKELEIIKYAGEQAASLTRQLLAFSRRQVLQPKVLNLNVVISDIVAMLKRIIGKDVELIAVLEPELEQVRVDPGQIEQVIMNLVVNARDAMPEGGRLIIRTHNVILDEDFCESIVGASPGTHICLSVEDTGVGMDKEIVEHIFEPFFTTKEAGTGLGLSVAYGIVKQHKGWIDLCSEPRKGSMFRVYLPALSEKVEEEPVEKVLLEELQGSGERILVVEDEEGVREITARMLRSGGYVVFEAANAEEALDVFEQEAGDFHLIFSDIVLPGKNGIQLVDQLTSCNPELRVLLVSGYTDGKLQWPIVSERGFRFLQKPYTLPALSQAVREAMGHKLSAA